MSISQTVINIFSTVVRWVFPLLALYILGKCVYSLLRTQPTKKVMAALVNVANHDELLLTSWENSIGRGGSSDIVLNYPPVSRSHAVISYKDKTWIIMDTNSKTGVTINGHQIEKSVKTPIKGGDRIGFGPIIMVFQPFDYHAER